MSGFTAYVRNVPYCMPADRPLLIVVLPMLGAFVVSAAMRYGAYLAWRACPQYAPSEASDLGRQIMRHTFINKQRSLGAVPISCGWDTWSEFWTLWVSRVALLVCMVWSDANAAVCFVSPLPIACTWITNLAVCNVALTNFKQKEHGIAAFMVIAAHAFVCTVMCVQFLRYEPALPPGTWIGLLCTTLVVDFLFVAYPGVASLARHTPSVTAATAASDYLISVENLVVGVGGAIPSLVTTATFIVAQ